MSDINKELWHTCQLCNKPIRDLAKIYGGCGFYYTKVFIQHLEKDHDISLEEYFTGIGVKRPRCACGCNKNTKINKKGSKFYWIKYACGRYPGTIKWSEEAKVSRRGSGNPMYQKEAWNKNLTKYTSTSLLKISLKRKNQKPSQATKLKMSESAKKRNFHGHTGRKHSGATKRFLRINTLRLIKEGVFIHTKTRPHKIMAKTLQSLV